MRIDDAALPLASVVIPTRDRAASLARTLPSILAQDYPRERLEVIVVDDGSSDATAEVVREASVRDPRVRLVRREVGGVNAARNAGIEAARGDPVLFTDDDVDLDRGWARALVDAALRNPQAGCLGGRYRLRFDGAPPRLCGRRSHFPEAELDLGPEERPVREVWGTSMAARRFALERVGLFDAAHSGGGDEIEWERRLATAGIPIVYAPAAFLEHRRSAEELGLVRLIRGRFRRQRTHARFCRRSGERVSLHSALRGALTCLAHALRFGCWGGVIDAAGYAGRAVGAFDRIDAPAKIGEAAPCAS